MNADVEEEYPGQWRKYPRKPVTFPSKDQMDRATEYCKKKRIGFSELVRKLLAERMRIEDLDSAPPQPAIRVIKEPGR